MIKVKEYWIGPYDHYIHIDHRTDKFYIQTVWDPASNYWRFLRWACYPMQHKLEQKEK